MNVRAIQQGFFGHLREVGEEFSIDNAEQFSKAWMEKVPAAKGKADKAAPKDDATA